MKVLLMGFNKEGEAREYLEEKGYEVVTQVIESYPEAITESVDYEAQLLAQIARVHAIYFEGNWRKDNDCKFAHRVAQEHAIPVMYEKQRRTRRPSPHRRIKNQYYKGALQ